MFRRLASDAPAAPSIPWTEGFAEPAEKPSPLHQLASDAPAPFPRTEGFAEPAETAPPPELPVHGFEEPAVPAAAPEAGAAPESAPAAPESEPASRAADQLPPAAPFPVVRFPAVALAPAPPPPGSSPSGLPPRSPHVQARVRELPVAPPVPHEPQNLADRLGSRLGEPSPARRFVAAPPSASDAAVQSPGPAQSGLPAAAASQPPEPAPKPAVNAVAPSPSPAMDRAGRTSMPRNRRLHRRVKLPAEIEIAGVACGLVDVSIGGFAATGAPEIAPNAVVPVGLWLSIDGIEVGTRLNARVIYANETRSSGRFIDLSASQTAFLRYIVTWRGESVGVVGTTTLLDAIAGVPERGAPGADRIDGPARERWWSGMIGRKVKPPR